MFPEAKGFLLCRKVDAANVGSAYMDRYVIPLSFFLECFQSTLLILPSSQYWGGPNDQALGSSRWQSYMALVIEYVLRLHLDGFMTR